LKEEVVEDFRVVVEAVEIEVLKEESVASAVGVVDADEDVETGVMAVDADAETRRREPGFPLPSLGVL